MGGGWGEPAAPSDNPGVTVERAFPLLSSGPLRQAVVRDLPAGVVVRTPWFSITEDEIAALIENAPQGMREQLRRNAFYLAEQVAARRVLLQEARRWAQEQGRAGSLPDEELLGAYLDHIGDRSAVSEADLRAFYEANRDIFGEASFATVRRDLEQYLRQQQRQRLIDAHIAAISERTPIEVDREWAERHNRLAHDNAVARARMSGRPTPADFGASGCGPCDMMTPILESLQRKYAGRLNVVFVHVGEERMLAVRCGVRAIPVQALFDGQGAEVFRHEGFWPQEEIERKLRDLGLAQ